MGLERCITLSFEGSRTGRFSGTIPKNCGYHPPWEKVGKTVFLGYIPPKAAIAKRVILTACQHVLPIFPLNRAICFLLRYFPTMHP